MNPKKEQTPNTPEPLYKRIQGHIGRPPKFETAGDLFDKLVGYGKNWRKGMPPNYFSKPQRKRKSFIQRIKDFFGHHE